jgi:tetratricopeptide (TPR) repeat protein
MHTLTPNTTSQRTELANRNDELNYQHLIKTGVKAHHEGNYTLAFDYWQQAIAKEPEQMAGYFLLDRALRKLGKIEEANKYYEKISGTFSEQWEEEYCLKLRVGHLQNSIVVPIGKTIKEDPNSFNQGRKVGIKSDRNLPFYCHNIRGVSLFTDINYLERQHEPEIELKGTHLYAGYLSRNYGEFMAECTHRLWAYAKYHSDIESVIIPVEVHTHKNRENSSKKSLSQFIKQALSYMQIPLPKVKLIDKPTQVEHLLVPEQASTLAYPLRLNEEYLDFLSENEETFFVTYQSPKTKYPDKIYVSRSHIIAKGGIAGEAYIEKLLEREEGFFIFKPEQYPWHEQINYYRNAKVCIFSEGSSIHGLELLGRLNKASQVIIVHRRRNYGRVFENIIASRTKHCLRYEEVDIVHPLICQPVNIHKPSPSTSLSILSNVNSLVRFFREWDIAKLNGFNLDSFYQQEAIDIAKYIINQPVQKYHPNRSDYFDKFINDVKKLCNNPYL